jgi:hypothetical protein
MNMRHLSIPFLNSLFEADKKIVRKTRRAFTKGNLTKLEFNLLRQKQEKAFQRRYDQAIAIGAQR